MNTFSSFVVYDNCRRAERDTSTDRQDNWFNWDEVIIGQDGIIYAIESGSTTCKIKSDKR